MATYTGGGGTLYVGGGAWSGPVARSASTQTGQAGGGAWSGPVARSASTQTGQAGGGVLDAPGRLRSDVVESVDRATQMQTGGGAATWSGPRSQPWTGTGHFVPGAGGFIPASYFRRVTGVVVDEDGTRITNADTILASGPLAAAGRVDSNGEFSLQVLRFTYSDFSLIVDSTTVTGGQVVYDELTGNPDLDTLTNHVVIKFDTSVNAGGGLLVDDSPRVG